MSVENVYLNALRTSTAAPTGPRSRPRRVPLFANIDIQNNENNLNGDNTSNMPNLNRLHYDEVAWNKVDEGNDPGSNYSFIYAETPGSKHCSDLNADL